MLLSHALRDIGNICNQLLMYLPSSTTAISDASRFFGKGKAVIKIFKGNIAKVTDK